MPIETKGKQIEKKDLLGGWGTEYVEIDQLKNKIDLSYLKDYISKNIKANANEMDVVKKMNGKEIYYVPVEDGKWNIVKYNVTVIDDDNGSEIIKLPIMDTDGNVLRIQSITRYIPMTKPVLDPIDFVCLGWWVLMSFLNWLKGVAPKVGISLSKAAIQEISASRLFANVLLEEVPKDAAGNIVSQWFQD